MFGSTKFQGSKITHKKLNLHNLLCTLKQIFDQEQIIRKSNIKLNCDNQKASLEINLKLNVFQNEKKCKI